MIHLGDTDSVSSDSGITSCYSSSDSSRSDMSDFMDLDEFLSMSKAAASKDEPSCAVTEQTDRCLPSAKPQEDPPPQISEEECSTESAAVDSEDTNSSVGDITETPLTVPGGRCSRRRKYVYNPVPIEKKAKRKFIPSKEKDSEYWNRRIKNNIAAKRSRDMRRQREIEVNQRYKDLEEENARLRAEIQALQDNARLLEKKIAEKGE